MHTSLSAARLWHNVATGPCEFELFPHASCCLNLAFVSSPPSHPINPVLIDTFRFYVQNMESCRLGEEMLRSLLGEKKKESHSFANIAFLESFVGGTISNFSSVSVGQFLKIWSRSRAEEHFLYMSKLLKQYILLYVRGTFIVFTSCFHYWELTVLCRLVKKSTLVSFIWKVCSELFLFSVLLVN